MHRPLLAAALLLNLAAAAVPAPLLAGERSGLQELGITTGYGPSERGDVTIVPLYLRFAWLFPDLIDEPLARHDINFRWFIEPWIAGVTNHQNAVEVGVTPIGFEIEYDAGQRVVPFISGGLGAMYTGLQGLELGGPFEFSSGGGAGLRFFLEQQLAITLSYRWRHISNAGIEEPNRGLDTNFILIGLESFPRR